MCKELKGIEDDGVKRECIDCVKDAALFLEDELKQIIINSLRQM